MRRNPPRLLQELCVCDQQDNLPGAPPTSPWAEVIMMADNIYLTATWMQKRLSLAALSQILSRRKLWTAMPILTHCRGPARAASYMKKDTMCMSAGGIFEDVAVLRLDPTLTQTRKQTRPILLLSFGARDVKRRLSSGSHASSRKCKSSSAHPGQWHG